MISKLSLIIGIIAVVAGLASFWMSSNLLLFQFLPNFPKSSINSILVGEVTSVNPRENSFQIKLITDEFLFPGGPALASSEFFYQDIYSDSNTSFNVFSTFLRNNVIEHYSVSVVNYEELNLKPGMIGTVTGKYEKLNGYLYTAGKVTIIQKQ